MSAIAKGDDSVDRIELDDRRTGNVAASDVNAQRGLVQPGASGVPQASAEAGWPSAQHFGHGSSNAVNVTINNTVPAAAPIQFVAGRSGHGLVTRLIWFVFVGWWLSALFIFLGYFFSATLILMPLGIWFLHRVPKAQTLRERSREFTQQFKDGVWVVTEGTKGQLPFLARAVYTLFVGLWAGLVWLGLAWLISLLIVTLPLSIWMIDRAPAVITLQKN